MLINVAIRNSEHASGNHCKSKKAAMYYSEIVRTYDLAPITVSDDPCEDYVFRIEILKRISSPEEFSVHVSRREAFVLRSLDEKRKAWNITVAFEDVTLDWQLISAESAESAFSKVVEEIIYAFPFLSEKGAIMPECYEVVKILDLEPISIPETDSYYRFRVEILKKNDLQGGFRARTYRFESFELQPSYPVIDGKPKYERAAPVILVEDSSPIFSNMESETLDELIREVMQVAEKIKTRKMCMK